jgi:hypothetical protein
MNVYKMLHLLVHTFSARMSVRLTLGQSRKTAAFFRQQYSICFVLQHPISSFPYYVGEEGDVCDHKL